MGVLQAASRGTDDRCWRHDPRLSAKMWKWLGVFAAPAPTGRSRGPEIVCFTTRFAKVESSLVARARIRRSCGEVSTCRCVVRNLLAARTRRRLRRDSELPPFRLPHFNFLPEVRRVNRARMRVRPPRGRQAPPAARRRFLPGLRPGYLQPPFFEGGSPSRRPSS